MSERDRWRLYRRWVYDARERWHLNIFELQEMFDTKAAELKVIRDNEDCKILSWADVVGMTTTGKQYRRLFNYSSQVLLSLLALFLPQRNGCRVSELLF